jgi:gliding motility-associated lipoprotein GldH
MILLNNYVVCSRFSILNDVCLRCISIKKSQKMKKLLLILIALSMAACSNSSATNKDFPDNRWAKSDVQTFKVDVAEEGTSQIGVLFSFVSGPQFTEIPVSIDVTAPDGSSTLMAVNLDLTGKGADSKLECAGDICDLRTVLKNKTALTKGSYTVTLKNNFKGPYVPNVLAVGVEVNNGK